VNSVVSVLIALAFGDEQVIDKLQSSAKAEKLCWASELPSDGLGSQVLEQMKEIKARDKHWQGRCSGAV
jgi:hypothetical protein